MLQFDQLKFWKRHTKLLTKVTFLPPFVHSVLSIGNKCGITDVHLYINWKDHKFIVCGVVWYLRIE